MVVAASSHSSIFAEQYKITCCSLFEGDIRSASLCSAYVYTPVSAGSQQHLACKKTACSVPMVLLLLVGGRTEEQFATHMDYTEVSLVLHAVCCNMQMSTDGHILTEFVANQVAISVHWHMHQELNNVVTIACTSTHCWLIIRPKTPYIQLEVDTMSLQRKWLTCLGTAVCPPSTN